MSLSSFFLKLHRTLFAHAALGKFNQHLLKWQLRSLGILNSDTEDATGEPHWLAHLAATNQIKTVVDVGANDAAYGAQELVAAQIHAFEPHPISFQRLKDRAPENVHAYHAAVGDINGTTTLWDFANDAPRKADQPTSQLASLYKNVITDLHGQPAKKYQVPITTLDQFAHLKRLNTIELLKVDAEGHELAVLRGASKLLKTNKIGIVQFEFNEMMAYSGVHFLDFAKLLPQYTFYRLLPNELLPLGQYRPLTHEWYGFQNIVALNREWDWQIV